MFVIQFIADFIICLPGLNIKILKEALKCVYFLWRSRSLSSCLLNAFTLLWACPSPPITLSPSTPLGQIWPIVLVIKCHLNYKKYIKLHQRAVLVSIENINCPFACGKGNTSEQFLESHSKIAGKKPEIYFPWETLQIAERSVPQWPTPQDFYSHMKKIILRYVPRSPELCFGLFCIILLMFCEEYYSEEFLKPFLLTGFCQSWCQSVQDVRMCWLSRDFEMFIVPFLKHIYMKNFTLVWTGFVRFLFSFPWQRLKASWNRNSGQFSWFKRNKWQLAESSQLMEMWTEKR